MFHEEQNVAAKGSGNRKNEGRFFDDTTGGGVMVEEGEENGDELGTEGSIVLDGRTSLSFIRDGELQTSLTVFWHMLVGEESVAVNN